MSTTKNPLENWGLSLNRQESELDLSTLKVDIPEVEEYLQKKKDELRKEVINDAEDNASKGIPKEKGGSLAISLSPYAAEIGNLCEHTLKMMQCTGLPKFIRDVRSEGEKKLKELIKRKEVLENDIRNLVRKHRDLSEKSEVSLTVFLTLLSIVIFCLGIDALYNAGAFQALGMSGLKSWLLSLVAVGGLGVFGYLLIEEFKKPADNRSVIKISILGVFILSCFIGLGYMRLIYFNEIGGQSVNVLFGIPPFVLINILIFGLTSYIIHGFFPSKEEWKLFRKKVKLKMELNSQKAKLDQLKEEIGQIEDDTRNKIRRAEELMNFADDQIRGLLAYYETIARLWIKEVSVQLPYTPDCIDQPLPEVKHRFVDRELGMDEIPKPSTNGQSDSSNQNNINYA